MTRQVSDGSSSSRSDSSSNHNDYELASGSEEERRGTPAPITFRIPSLHRSSRSSQSEDEDGSGLDSASDESSESSEESDSSEEEVEGVHTRRTRGKRTIEEKSTHFRVVKSEAFQEWGFATQLLQKPVPMPEELLQVSRQNTTNSSADSDEEVMGRRVTMPPPSTLLIGRPRALKRSVTQELLPRRPRSPSGDTGRYCRNDEGELESFVNRPPRGQKAWSRGSQTPRRRRSITTTIVCESGTGTCPGLRSVMLGTVEDARKKRAAQLCNFAMVRSVTHRTMLRQQAGAQQRQQVRLQANAFQNTYARCVDEVGETVLTFRPPARAHSIDLGEMSILGR